jgi:hypothetical protein
LPSASFLDGTLRVTTASQAFYETFRVSPDETVGQYIYDLGNGTGTFLRCEHCWRKSFHSRGHSRTSKSRTTFPVSGQR